MTTKQFKGKVIYNPSGKAGEYAKWAANFYNGCSGRCEYCYNRKGITAKVLGGDKPTLKAGLNIIKARHIFVKEVDQNLTELRKHGLFFNFVSDPFLPETIDLNIWAMFYCVTRFIPVKALTKQAHCADHWIGYFGGPTNLLAFGFTLTGHDELEPGCSTNQERIHAMKRFHDAGFKTWASIEPIINLKDSFTMIDETKYVCGLYKIGLQSGKQYDTYELRNFIVFVNDTLSWRRNVKIYWKDSLLKQAGFDRKDLPEHCVDRDYNMFSE